MHKGYGSWPDLTEFGKWQAEQVFVHIEGGYRIGTHQIINIAYINACAARQLVRIFAAQHRNMRAFSRCLDTSVSQPFALSSR